MKSARSIAEKVLQVAAPGLVEGRETLLNEIAGAVEAERRASEVPPELIEEARDFIENGTMPPDLRVVLGAVLRAARSQLFWRERYSEQCALYHDAAKERDELLRDVAVAWSVLTGWDAIRIANGSHEASRDPARALVDAARVVVRDRDEARAEVERLRAILGGAEQALKKVAAARDKERIGPAMFGALVAVDWRLADISEGKPTPLAAGVHQPSAWLLPPAPLPHLADALADVPSHVVPGKTVEPQAGDVRETDRPLGTCDWGGCDEPSVRERFDGREWLPVCGACSMRPSAPHGFEPNGGGGNVDG